MKVVYSLVVLCVLCLVPTLATPFAVTLEQSPVVDLTFSPNGGTTAKLVAAIKTCTAGEQLLVVAYSFTSKSIVEALISAKKAGVDVQILVDKGQEKNKRSGWQACASAGIPVYFDVVHAIQHNKVMVLGNRGVTFGSFNFTANAEQRNAENNVVVWSPVLAKAYAENWQVLVRIARRAP